MAPHLKRAGIDHARLAVKIEGVKNKRLALGVEDPAKRLLRAAAAIDIKHIRDIQLSRAHQFTNIAIGTQILIRVFEPALLIFVS